MAFKSPIISPLTESQDLLLSQLGSLKNLLSLPQKKRMSLSPEDQISSFDYMLRICENTVGSGVMDILLKKFIDKVFDPADTTLERAILKGIGKSLQKNGTHISSDPNQTNEQWLNANALSALHTVFQVAKALLVKQIIGMIFGPKERMRKPTDPTSTLNSPDPFTDLEYLDQVVVANEMFSISTSESKQYGDIEYNSIKLRNELERGQVTFIISCQEVKIQLPTNFEQDIDGIINDTLASLPGTTVASQSMLIKNPAIAFNRIIGHVGTETQRINNQENVNSVKKSFLQILVEKILNLLVISIVPYLTGLTNQINAQTGINSTVLGLISSPLQLKNLYKSDPQQFDKKSEFTSVMINALYALLLSIILKELIVQVKKLIKNAIAKRAANKLQNRFKRFSKAKSSITGGVDTLNKAKRAAEALKQFNHIFNYSELT